jgi:hypothetical protein
VVASIGAGLVLELGQAAVPDDLAGMVNPNVTQANIADTICRRGWTRTMRPSRDETDAIKRNLAYDQGVEARNLELDHVMPLVLGGAPADLHNLVLQPWTGACNAHQKDELDGELGKAVCMGSVELVEVLREIARDWKAAYREWINPKGCGD